MFVGMTIHDASRQLRFQLFHLYDEREAAIISDVVMEHLTGWKKIDRIVNKTVPLTVQQQKILAGYTAALLEHKPMQYVLQEAWFYGMPLYVDENVLIPRPETEELVDWLIKDKQLLQPAVQSSEHSSNNVLDIGTGSGCIPLAIKKNLSSVNMHSCDISEAALNVARRNAHNLNLSIQFHHLDILSEASYKDLPVFDSIISNPPYIPNKEKAAIAGNVLRYEPHLALFTADDTPLVFYKAIAVFAGTHLKKHGLIYLEIHEDRAAAVLDLFNAQGFTQYTLRQDLQGKDRMIKIVNA